MARVASAFYPMPHDQKSDDDELAAILSRLSGGTSEPDAESVDDATKVRCPTCGKFMMGRPIDRADDIENEVTAPQHAPFRAIGRRRRLRAARLAAAAKS